MRLPARRARFHALARALALCSDAQLQQHLATAEPLGSGIGGRTLRWHFEGQPVFVKLIRLTALELRPEHRHSTANLFGLPPWYQRNVGSAGFGAWRELAAHQLANAAVLGGQFEGLPLVFHHRVLPAEPPDAAARRSLGGTEEMVAYWGGHPAVRARLQALRRSRACIALFMEHLPGHLADWLDERCHAPAPTRNAALRNVEHALVHDLPRLNALGLLHGDAHLRNILTCGQRLYYADLGLALSPAFALAADERRHLAHHAQLDQAYVRAKWVNGLLQRWAPEGSTPQERFAWVEAVAAGAQPRGLLPGLPAVAAASVRRHAGVAAVVNRFYVALHTRSRRTPWPRQRVAAALQATA